MVMWFLMFIVLLRYYLISGPSFKLIMMHDCNIRVKKPDSNIPNIDDPLVKLEENIIIYFSTSD